jgi:outer membrane protein TolC
MHFKWKLIALTGMMMQLLTYAYAQQQPSDTGTTMRFSAKDAVSYALANQYAVRTAKLDELKQLAVNKEVSGLALPQLSASGQFQDNPIIQKQLLDASNFDPTVPKGTLVPFSFGLKYNAVGTVNLNQTLFDPSVLVALQARKTLEELARRGVQKSEVDVKAEVYKAYYNVVAADKALGILQESIARMRKSLDETTQTYKEGLVEKLDVDRLSVQMNNLVTEEVRLRNLRDVGLAALKFQMGMPIRQSLELTDTLGTEEIKAVLDQQQGFAYQNRIEYLLLESQKKANEYNLKRYKLQALPSLSAFGTGGISRQSNQFDYFESELWYGYVSWGLNLSIPIFSGMQRKRKVDQAWIDVKKSELDLENMRNVIDLDQSQSTINLRNNIRTLESQEENMKLAQEVLRMTNIKYTEGIGSSLEVITAETSLLTAQNNYFTALFDAMVSRIDYLKAYGKL